MNLNVEAAQMKNISYLRARDPSIVTGNFQLDNIRVNLFDKIIIEQEQNNDKDSNTLQTYLRIKPTANYQHLYEVVDEKTLLCKIPKGSYAMRNIREGDIVTRKYTFSKILNVDTTQTNLFNDIVKRRILNFINGRHCTILTYGASGSGKTYTISGTDTEPGIIPRALEYMFRSLPTLPDVPLIKPEPNGNINADIDFRKEKEIRENILRASSTLSERNLHIKTYRNMQKRLSTESVALLDPTSDLTVSVWVSFAEIYNEHIYDLLLPEPPRGKERKKLRLGKSNNKVYIKELTQVNVVSGIEAYEILQYGLHNLQFASTGINAHSSRSHSIFTIKLVQASKSQNTGLVTCLNFCDLAGSERLKKTKNIGDRLKESNNINTSLMVLGKCISAVREAQKFKDNRLVPFRETKLTQLFQNALMGFEDISLIVNINPVEEMFDESQHVLNFSAIAKDIIVEQQQKVIPVKNNRFTQYMHKRNSLLVPIIEESLEVEYLRGEVSRLMEELEYEKEESEKNELEARREVTVMYEEIIQSIKLEKDREMKTKLASLDKKYREEIEQLKKKPHESSIICLDSSSEEESENKEILELNKELEVLKRSNQAKEQIISILNKKIEDLKKQNLDLSKIADQSGEAYNDLIMNNNRLQQEMSILKSEILKLEERIGEQEEEILCLKNLNDQNDDLEETEELKTVEGFVARENADDMNRSNHNVSVTFPDSNETNELDEDQESVKSVEKSASDNIDMSYHEINVTFPSLKPINVHSDKEQNSTKNKEGSVPEKNDSFQFSEDDEKEVEEK